MTRSVKIDEAVYRKIKKIAIKERRDLKTILELAVVSFLQKRILEK